MNTPVSHKDIRRLLDDQKTPCLSLYQPTLRSYPDNQQNAIRFRNLVRDLEKMTLQLAGEQGCRRLLQPFHELEEDAAFWGHPRDGLAILRTPELFRIFKLQRPVPELVVVSDSLHLKPLLRIVQSADRFQVLCLDRDKIRLFEGNRDAFDETDLAPGIPRTLEDALGDQLTAKDQSGFTNARGDRAGIAGYQMRHGPADRDVGIDRDRDRFFQIVDRAVLEFHSRSDEIPLILAALPENQGHFRGLSQNPFLLAQGIDSDPNSLAVGLLRERAWQIMRGHYQERLSRLIDEYGESKAKELGTDQLELAGEAGACNRIRTLLVDADLHVQGRLYRDTGKVELLSGTAPDADDVLDDLMELTLQHGGDVVVVPHERMPSESGIAAIYRF